MDSDWQGATATREQFGALITSLLNTRCPFDAPFDRFCIQSFAAEGLLTGTLSVASGGVNLSFSQWGRTLEELGYLCHDLSFPAVISLYASVISILVEIKGPEDELIKDMLCGKKLGSFAYTEEVDVYAHRTHLCRTSSGLMINGAKAFVTGGSTADIFLVFARTDEGDVAVSIVERQDPGVEVIVLPTHGLCASGVSKLLLHDVPLPPERLIIKRGGLELAQQWLNTRRPLLVCASLGRARAMMESCASYVSQTRRFGLPLAEVANVQASFGRIYALLEASRSVIFRALERMSRREADDIWDPISSMAKYIAVENLNHIAVALFKMGGGAGYLEAAGLGRLQRDVAALLCGGDPQDLLEINLGIQAIADCQGRNEEA